MTAHMTRVAVGSEKELFLYEAALAMTFAMDGSPSRQWSHPPNG
jgi:hypothetical protein